MPNDNKKSVINRGKRIYTLRPGPDGQKRTLEPGKSIECLDDAEFKILSGYTDIGDVDKIAPQLAKREEDLRKQLAQAKADNERLSAQREAALREAKEESKPETTKQTVTAAPRARVAPVKAVKKGK